MLKGHVFLVAGSGVSIADLSYVKTDIEITGSTILPSWCCFNCTVSLTPFHKIFRIFLPGLSLLAIQKVKSVLISKDVFSLIAPCSELPLC